MQAPRTQMASQVWMEPSYPSQPETAWTTGAYHHMPILGGTTKDEGTFGLSITEYFSGPPQVALTPAQYLANNSAAVLAEYPLSNYGGNPTLAQDRVGSDSFLKCPALRVLNQQAGTNTGFGVYGYDFTYQNAPYYFPQMPNPYDPTGYFQALAYHTADIQFVFPKWHGGNLGVNLSQDAISPATTYHANCRAPRLPYLTRSWGRGRTSRRPAIRTDRDFPRGQCSLRARVRSSRRISPTRSKAPRTIATIITVPSGLPIRQIKNQRLRPTVGRSRWRLQARTLNGVTCLRRFHYALGKIGLARDLERKSMVRGVTIVFSTRR